MKTNTDYISSAERNTSLVVGNEGDRSVFVGRTLRSRGFETIERDNQDTALDLVERHMTSLIVGDVMMEGGNGFMNYYATTVRRRRFQ